MFSFLHHQAVKDDIGSIRIQRPHKGPFYVSDKTIDQLIANLGKWSRFVHPLLSSLDIITRNETADSDIETFLHAIIYLHK